MCTHIYTYINIHMHLCIYIYTSIYTYIYVDSCISLGSRAIKKKSMKQEVRAEREGLARRSAEARVAALQEEVRVQGPWLGSVNSKGV